MLLETPPGQHPQQPLSASGGPSHSWSMSEKEGPLSKGRNKLTITCCEISFCCLVALLPQAVRTHRCREYYSKCSLVFFSSAASGDFHEILASIQYFTVIYLLPGTSFFLCRILYSAMTETANRKCRGVDCPNDAGTLQCPTCLKGGTDSFFCSQDCFKRSWVSTPR